MNELLAEALKYLTPAAGIVVIFVVLIALNPEKLEVWASIVNKMLSGFGGAFKSAHRRYVKHDLQGRINSFTKQVSKSAPYFENTQVVIEFVDVQQDKKAFLTEGKTIIRLRRDDPDDLNFVHGSYWAVATCLLPKVKRYISPSQRQALDLYVTQSIIKRQKVHVIEHFLEQYLHPGFNGKMEGSQEKVQRLFEQFSKIDKYGVFYPLFLQELYFLSQKVYGGPKKEQIISEASRLVDFLERVSGRLIGQEMELEFRGEYCRFAIVIVGKSFKVESDEHQVYINYIQKIKSTHNLETIYVLGKQENQRFIDEVCGQLSSEFEIYKKHKYEGELSTQNGKVRQKGYLVVVRCLGVELYQSA